MPGPKPRDIYAEVAAPLTENLKALARERTEDGKAAKWWLETTSGAIPRSLTKRPVMILPYGGTMSAYFKYIRDWLAEYRPDLLEVEGEDDEDLRERVSFLARHLWQVVGEGASGGVAVMKWLKECCRAVASSDQPIYWVTPAGFVVRHFYGQTRRRTIKQKIDGQRFEIYDREATKHADTAAQVRGVAPNFVHSLDAAALMILIDDCLLENISSLSPIHDNIGALAADMSRVHELIRGSFVKVHEEGLLREFRENCAVLLTTHLIVTKGMTPEEAHDEAEKVLPATIQMGALDLREVLKSEYFFS
jgi:DNA-directed RNA polymerase